MNTLSIGTSVRSLDVSSGTSSAAARMQPSRRGKLGVNALARTKSIAELARQQGVSRNFVYRQKARAEQAIDDAFRPPARNGERVLFTVQVTKSLLEQIVLALVLC